jgi:hypothetical protein
MLRISKEICSFAERLMKISWPDRRQSHSRWYGAGTMLKTLTLADGSTRQIHLGGYTRQRYDKRDKDFSIRIPAGLSSPSAEVNLTSFCPPVCDQGSLGSCTANMFAGAVEYNEIRRLASGGKLATLTLNALTNQRITRVSVEPDGLGGLKVVTLDANGAVVSPTPAPAPPPAPAGLERSSRLFSYHATREIEHTVNEDSGASIRDTIKAGAKFGVVDEKHWPYDVSKFAVKPPASCYAEGKKHVVTSYHAIADGDLATMKATLAGGLPICFGFTVYASFMSQAVAKTGIVPMPAPGEQVEGGHAVLMVGYSDARQAFLVRNSWGDKWGQKGYFWLPFAYVSDPDLASDFWVVVSAPI